MVMLVGRHAALRPESPPLVGLRALWFGLFGAPAAWALQLIVSYALVAHFCYPRSTPLASPAFGGTRVVATVVSAALIVVAMLALVVALRSTRAAGDAESRARFLAMAGVLVSGIFVYGTLMAALPLVSMRPCTL
jgi:phosphotransferase system  glucose/maltose/N-acetylglucosamine-specific IIC component